MEIKSIQKTVVETEIITYKYSEKELQELITNDLQSKGYEVKNIYFDTDYRYVEDEWGMNRHLQSCLKGVTAVVTK